MVKSISKKCFSIFMILVLMFSVFTIPVHAEVLTVSTAVGVAVIAGTLIAAGVYCANPQYRQAINAAAMDFISRQANFLSTIKVVATATGKVFAIWGSNLWNSFTDWVKNTLCAGNVSLGGYAIPLAELPSIISPASAGQFTSLQKNTGIVDWYIGGSRITTAYGGARLALSNGQSNYGLNLYNNCYYGWSTIGQVNTGFSVCLYEMQRSTSDGWGPTNNLNNIVRAVYNANTSFNVTNLSYSWTIYGHQGYFSFNNGNVSFSGAGVVSTGWESFASYILACISAGLFLGNFTALSGGQNVPVNDHYSPNVRIRYADNTIPGLDPATGSAIGSIIGSLPYNIGNGQNVITPVWGKWVNGDGIPVAWSGPTGTYGGPNSTTAVGTTIAGTANPPITYPGDDVINPKLARDGVAPFPTLGDDVINPADDTFITDLDDYIDPTIDRLTSPTDVTTLTQNPTDTLGPTTDVFPESDDIPNTIRDTATDTIPDVDSPAIPDVDTATDTATPINPDASDDTSTDERNTNRLKLSTLILSKFPFCIPWDIYRTVATMVQEPEIPAFDWRFSLPTFNIDETIHIDFEQFETVAYIVRWFLSACWLVTLVLLTRKVIWK